MTPNGKDTNSAFGAVDMGNSRIKLFLNGSCVRLNVENSEWPRTAYNFLLQTSIANIKLGLISVSSLDEEFVIESLSDLSGVWVKSVTDSIINSNDIIDINGVSGIGADRVAGLIGALQYEAPPLFTVDCGTAVTFNILLEGNKCGGGAIMAGVRTQLRALHEYTGKLPLFEPADVALAAGRTTRQAMQIGAVDGTVGAIVEMHRNACAAYNLPAATTILLTGGDAPLLLNKLQNRLPCIVHIEHLVSEGVAAYMRATTE